ncbi:MAG: protein kinase [Pirellula sp.]
MNKQAVFEKASEELRGLIANRSASASECLFDRYPEIRSDRDTALEIIYYEYVLRREVDASGPVTTEDFCRRFPDFRDDIVKLFQVDEAFSSLGMEGSVATTSSLARDESNRMLSEETLSRSSETYLGSIGDYRLVEVIGRGGMGMVYRAVQERLGRDVALKTISMIESLDPETITRFRKEAELASRLQHPNIAQIYEIGAQHQVPYYSMEYVAGGSLSDVVYDRPVKPDIAAQLVAVLARAVDHAHQRGVLHRDLKPGNILLAPSQRPEAICVPIPSNSVTPNRHDSKATPKSLEPLPKFEPKIIDFGLAIRWRASGDSDSGDDDKDRVVGTPSYMAPEQADTSRGGANPRSDIYSLGAILYHLLVGRPPFNAATTVDTIRQVLVDEPISPRSIQSRIPVDLETICMKCLQKEPERRYSTGSELADDLQRFLNRVPIRAKPASLYTTTRKWARRHPSLTSLIFASTLAMVAIVWLWQRSESSLASERKAKERSEQLIYDRDIALASFEYRSNNIERTRELLGQCQPKYRNWEWTYLNNLCNEPMWISPIQSAVARDADFSPDGRYVVTCHGRWAENHEEFVEIWDTQLNLRKHRILVHPHGSVLSVCFSPDGRSILTTSMIWDSKGGQAGAVEFDVETGEKVAQYATGNCSFGRYHPNGESIFVGTAGGSIVRYPRSINKPVELYKRHQGMILGISISSDGRRCVSSSRDGKVCLWDIENNRELDCVVEMGDPRQVVIAPERERVYVVDFSGTVRVFRMDSDRLQLESTNTRNSKPLIAFSPDGLWMATAVFGEGADLRDRMTGRVVRQLHSHRGHVRALAFDASARRLMTAGADGELRVWDISEPNPFVKHAMTDGAAIANVAYRPNRPQFALGAKRNTVRPIEESGAPRIELWNSIRLEREKTLVGHSDWITCVEFNSEGSLLISGAQDKTVRVWDPETGMELSVHGTHSHEIVGAYFLDDSKSALSVDRSGEIRVWDIESAETVWATSAINPAEISSKVSAMAFSSELGYLVIAVEGEECVQVWDVGKRTRLAIQPYGQRINSLAISAVSKVLAIASDSPVIELWSTDFMIKPDPSKTAVKLNGHSDKVLSVSFSGDGKRLVAASFDETLRLFDIELGCELMTLEGLKGADNRVSFSRDSDQILRCEGRNLNLWSLSPLRQNSSSNDHESKLRWHKECVQSAVAQQNAFAVNFHATALKLLRPQDPIGWLEMARSLIDQRDWIGAERELLTALEIEDSPEARLLLLRSYLANGSVEPLHKECQLIIESAMASKNDTTLNSAAWNCAIAGCPGVEPESLVRMMQSVCERSRTGTHFNTLALAQYRASQYDEAIASAQNSMKIKPGDSQPFDWIIIALSRCRKINQSLWKDPKTIALIEQDVNQVNRWVRDHRNRDRVGLVKSIRWLWVDSVELPRLLRELDEQLRLLNKPLLLTSLK